MPIELELVIRTLMLLIDPRLRPPNDIVFAAFHFK